MEMPNIKYNGDVSKFITAEDDIYDAIMYNKDQEYFLDSMNLSKFVKGVERLVRTSPDYTAFISILKRNYGLNFSQISPKITDEDADIEMHHGPLFTLYDICEVVTMHFLKHNYKVNSFTIADRVLDEHWERRVQIIMITSTEHDGIHNRDIFINCNQCFGDIDAFIKKYTDGLSDEQKYKIWNYVNLCNNNPAFAKSFDKGLLDLDYVKKYIKV